MQIVWPNSNNPDIEGNFTWMLTKQARALDPAKKFAPWKDSSLCMSVTQLLHHQDAVHGADHAVSHGAKLTSSAVCARAVQHAARW